MGNSKQRSVETFLIIMAIVGGFRVVFNKFAINNGFGAYAIVAAQFLIGGLILSIYLRGKIFFINKKYFILAIFASIMFFLAFYLGTLGLVYTTPSKNAFLYQTSIVFVPFLYYFVYKQNIDKHTIIGVVIAMCGLAFLTLENGFDNINIGDILTILAAVMVALHTTFSSFAMKKNECNPVVFTTIQMFVSGVLALVLAFINDDFSSGISLTISWPLLLGGILTGFTFYGISLGFKYSTPTKMSLINSLNPVSSTIAAIMCLNEVITYRLFVGGGLIMASLLVIQLKPNLSKFSNREKAEA